MLILHDLVPYHWAVAGVLLGAITLLLLWTTNQRLGISTGFENVCSVVLHAPYFQRPEIVGSRGWRLPFLGGLVLGGFLSAVLGGGWAPIWDLGLFDTRIGWGPAGKLVWMFGGGLLIGFGTRLAGGCTSGHGIFGISNGERASVESTLAFMAAGIVTSHLVFWLAGAPEMPIVYLCFGTAFGWVLSRSGAADYDYVQRMFLFESIQLYGIIGVAVLTTGVGLRLLRASGRTLGGAPLRVSPKPRHPGNVAGGILFGVGWAVTGMCPGPILVNVGEGKLYALAALAGALVGAGAFGILYERLARPLGLPVLDLGTGDG